MSVYEESVRGNDFEEKIFSSEFIYDPVSVIERFDLATVKYGENKVFEDRRFQKLREMWISAVFLLGFYEMTEPKIDYWLKPCYGQWPDTYGVFFSPRKDIENADTQNWVFIEITEYGDYSNNGLTNQILKKVVEKNYSGKYILVVYIKKLLTKIDLKSVFQKLKKQKLSCLYVFVVTSDLNTLGDHCVVCLYPKYTQENFYLRELMKKLKKEYDGVKVEKKRGHDISPLTYGPFLLPEL
jgi:hypothetical protein